MLGREMKSDMSSGMRGHVDHRCAQCAQLDNIPAAHMHIERGYPFGFVRRPRDDAPRRSLNLRIAADMVGVPMRVPNLRNRPPTRRRSSQDRSRHRRIDDQSLAALRRMHQPDIIVRQNGDAHDLQHTHHAPTLGMLAHGSAGARCPSCSSSIEIPSGVRTKAICPSRGGRLIVTPASINV